MSDDQRPTPRPGVMDIAPYVPGRSKAAAGVKLHKLSSNETPLGPSPRALEAFQAAAATLELYPDGSATALRQAIGTAYGLNPDRIVCGSGSDELLKLIAEAYIGPGDEAIYSQYGFLVYPIAVKAAGGTSRVAPEKNLTADVDAILRLVNERTRVVFLANPNNPTGTYLPFKEVRRLHAALPGNVLLVLDAAYAEYVRRNDYESGIELAGTAPNVVMTRTFSKIHGPRRHAHRLVLRPGRGRRRAQPHPRPIQCVGAGDRGGRGGDRRPQPHGAGHRPQRRVAGHRDQRDPRARLRGDAERRELRADPFPQDQGERARPMPTRSFIQRGVVLQAGRGVRPAGRAPHDHRLGRGQPQHHRRAPRVFRGSRA